MKFSTFFGKYTICTLIYSIISMLVGIAGFGALYLIGKKAAEKDDEKITQEMVAKHLNDLKNEN